MFNGDQLVCLLEQYPGSIFWIAYSGGLDSQVLLHSLSLVAPVARLHAIHINHGLHSDSAMWGEVCQRSCAQRGVHCEVVPIDVNPQRGESLEACARAARYTAMAKRLLDGDCLLTAHHRDDQAETLLLQLLRGAGLPGLAGMPVRMPFGNGHLLRPLLDFTRSELHHYAQIKQLTWIEDSSNAQLRFNRNFVRHRVLPLLHQRWPAASKTLARVAEHAAEAQQLLEELAYEDYLKVRGPCANSVVVTQLLRLSSARLRNGLRYWLRQLHFPLPSQKQLEQIELLLESKRDATPKVNWGKIQIRRYQDLLYALTSKEAAALPGVSVPWNLQQTLMLPVGILAAERVVGYGISCKKLAVDMPATVTISFRQGGERFHMQGRSGSHPLKKLFQEWQVPPWQRQQVPLAYYQEKLIAVTGYGVDPNFLANRDEWGYVIRLKSDANKILDISQAH